MGSSCQREKLDLLPAVVSQSEGCGVHHRACGSEVLRYLGGRAAAKTMYSPACSQLPFLLHSYILRLQFSDLLYSFLVLSHEE